jgi:hypothetical protein
VLPNLPAPAAKEQNGFVKLTRIDLGERIGRTLVNAEHQEIPVRFVMCWGRRKKKNDYGL